MAKDLQSLSKKELIELAKKKDIKMPYLYRKAELIKLIKKKDEPTPARISKPRGRAATRLSARKPNARGGRIPKVAATPKPYYEPTYHQEALQPAGSSATTETYIPPANGELPQSYHETKIVLMSRDPYWAYTYWDLSHNTREKINELFRENYGSIKSILRVYDVTDVDFDGKNAHRWFDIEIFIDAANWYLNLGIANRSYMVDLGLLDSKGNFYLIARSNVIRTPRDCPSEVVDEEWMAVDFEEIYALSGGFGIGISSQELRQRKKKLFEQLLNAPGSMLFSGGVSSFSSPSVSKEKAVGKDFFLQVSTELIVYGRTMPDAKVTVSGEPVKLRPDGTFSLRYFLPDGEKHLPIQAVSQDGDDKRKAHIRVAKDTSAE